MPFGPSHYVPVLKIKPGEKAALALLADGLTAGLTPLLQAIEKTDAARTWPSHLKLMMRGLDAAVARYPGYFLDARELDPLGPKPSKDLFAAAASIGVPFVPVTGISRTIDLAAALSAATSGLAIRIERSELESGHLTTMLAKFLATHGLKEAQVDLIVDLGTVHNMVGAGVSTMLNMLWPQVPTPKNWRTLTLIASAFPISMGVVDKESHEFVPRHCWRTWRDDLHAQRAALPRLPSFGDCGVQHPKGVEGFDFRMMKPSPSIRYTVGDDWLLLKGESTKSTRPGIQFPKIAQRLLAHPLGSQFHGAAHCAGCNDVASAAAGKPKFGAAQTWRRIGTVHHLTAVVEQLAALTWP